MVIKLRKKPFFCCGLGGNAGLKFRGHGGGNPMKTLNCDIELFIPD